MSESELLQMVEKDVVERLRSVRDGYEPGKSFGYLNEWHALLCGEAADLIARLRASVVEHRGDDGADYQGSCGLVLYGPPAICTCGKCPVPPQSQFESVRERCAEVADRYGDCSGAFIAEKIRSLPEDAG